MPAPWYHSNMYSQPPGQQGAPYHPSQPPYAGPPGPPKKGVSTWVIVLVCVLGGAVFVLGPMSVIAIAGVRKYLANAKTAEARVSLAQIGKLARSAHARDGRLCGSATRAVPEDASAVRARKYQSSSAEWERDAARNGGFACLGFSLSSPQYFQYSYAASPAGDRFTAEAHGDLDGDGVVSTFRVEGRVTGDGTLVVAPTVLEIDPLE